MSDPSELTIEGYARHLANANEKRQAVAELFRDALAFAGKLPAGRDPSDDHVRLASALNVTSGRAYDDRDPVLCVALGVAPGDSPDAFRLAAERVVFAGVCGMLGVMPAGEEASRAFDAAQWVK